MTILLEHPTVNTTATEMPGTTNIGSDDTNAVASNSQSNFTVMFETPPASENIVDIRVSAGTSEGEQDIFPAQQVCLHVLYLKELCVYACLCLLCKSTMRYIRCLVKPLLNLWNWLYYAAYG